MSNRRTPVTVYRAEIITEIRYVERETGERNISPNKKQNKTKIEIIERFYITCVCNFKGFPHIFLACSVCVYVWGTRFSLLSL